MSLNSSIQVSSTFPSIQLLGLEMLLHYFLGPEAAAVAAKNKLILSLGESLEGFPLLPLAHGDLRRCFIFVLLPKQN